MGGLGLYPNHAGQSGTPLQSRPTGGMCGILRLVITKVARPCQKDLSSPTPACWLTLSSYLKGKKKKRERMRIFPALRKSEWGSVLLWTLGHLGRGKRCGTEAGTAQFQVMWAWSRQLSGTPFAPILPEMVTLTRPLRTGQPIWAAEHVQLRFPI